jgi:hypothetical protein
MRIRANILPVLLMSAGLSGCIFGGKKPVKVASPIQPTSLPQPVAKPAPPPTEPSGPQAVGSLPAPPVAAPTAPTPALTLPELPPTDKPSVTPPPRRPSRPRQPAQPASPPPAETQPPAAVPVPQLAEILSDAQRRQAETEMAEHLTRARDILTRASRATLNSGQVETRERVRIFIQQAENTKDLSTALQLALRADVLAQDLLPALR